MPPARRDRDGFSILVDHLISTHINIYIHTPDTTASQQIPLFLTYFSQLSQTPVLYLQSCTVHTRHMPMAD